MGPAYRPAAFIRDLTLDEIVAAQEKGWFTPAEIDSVTAASSS